VGSDKLKTVVVGAGRACGPEFFSVTYGAGGATREKTLATVQDIAAMGHEAAPHLSRASAARANPASREILDTYRTQGIRRPGGAARRPAQRHRHRGRIPPRLGPACPSSARTQGEDWHIEVAAYPEYHPQQRYARQRPGALRGQGDAPAPNSGHHAVLLNPDAYFHFVDEVRALGVEVPIVPGIMPIHNYAKIAQFAAARRHRDPALGGAEDGRLTSTTPPACAPSALDVVARLCERLRGRRRAGNPLLHAQPVGPVAGGVPAAGRGRRGP
jgi:methylenetetrahydrofolate reductase (NADPH)